MVRTKAASNGGGDPHRDPYSFVTVLLAGFDLSLCDQRTRNRQRQQGRDAAAR